MFKLLGNAIDTGAFAMQHATLSSMVASPNFAARGQWWTIVAANFAPILEANWALHDWHWLLLQVAMISLASNEKPRNQ